MTTITKTIKLNLPEIDGNAFALLGAFRRQATMEDWTQKEINEVLTEAQSKDYNHLITTLSDHCD